MGLDALLAGGGFDEPEEEESEEEAADSDAEIDLDDFAKREKISNSEKQYLKDVNGKGKVGQLRN